MSRDVLLNEEEATLVARTLRDSLNGLEVYARKTKDATYKKEALRKANALRELQEKIYKRMYGG